MPAAIFGAVLAVILAGCGGTSGPHVGAPVAHAGAAGIDLTFADGASSLANTGTYGDDIDVALVTAGGASARTIQGPDGKGIGLPTFSATPGSPEAVVKITDQGSSGSSGVDRLNPGTKDFAFGAAFEMDPGPTSQEPSDVDDGDNLLQRGLYGERSQYKIELDTRSPTCTLHGRAGRDGYRGVLDMRTAPGFPSAGVRSGTWYRVRCARTGSADAELTVSQLSRDGSVARTWTTHDIEPAMPAGAALDLTPATPGTPLSVGGKLDDQGHLVTGESVDQFNGEVDDVTLSIG
ncbi:MAG TPA: hypothetical protein VH085_14700 [Nocardioides sp.]|nr:hypothetical protein [Nocardioides sp.]